MELARPAQLQEQPPQGALRPREVLTLADGVYGAGRHVAQMSAEAKLSPGLYFVRMTVPGKTLTTRFMQMK